MINEGSYLDVPLGSTLKHLRSEAEAHCDQHAQVAAYTSGRSSVSPHDCTLLQHVLWQRPEESERIADHILKRLATDEQRLQQIDYLFKGEAFSAQRKKT